MSGGAQTEQYANDGYTHVAGLNTPPAALTISIGEVPAAGTYTLTIFYENSTGSDGLTEPRDMNLLVNGHLVGTLNFAVTSSWYETASDSTTASVQVPSGLSTFSIACQAGDSCHVNLWKIKLAQ
jgi:archaellum component FlaG (FlaF/FlaG flagellin family)